MIKNMTPLITSNDSALEVIFNEMRYINLRFTYLLTYLLTSMDILHHFELNNYLHI